MPCTRTKRYFNETWYTQSHKPREPKLLLSYIWSYFPSIIFHTISCPLYNSETERDISMKLGTLIKHNEDDVSCLKTITLACIYLELFPFDYFPYNFVSAL